MGFGTFIMEWGSEIVAILIWSLLLWMLTFLPDKYKFHKRLAFWLKVKKVICQIKVSIPLQQGISFSQLQNKFHTFWSHNTSNVKEANGVISFNSKVSGSTYDIKTVEDSEEERNFITINNFNGFTIGFFGGIKNLNVVTNEIKRITELFNDERKGDDKIITEISLTPRKNSFLSSKLRGDFVEENYNCSFNTKHIKITNKGHSDLEKNISKIVYDWMIRFV